MRIIHVYIQKECGKKCHQNARIGTPGQKRSKITEDSPKDAQAIIVALLTLSIC